MTFIKFGQALPRVGRLALFKQFNFCCNSLVHDPAHDMCIVLRNVFYQLVCSTDTVQWEVP